MCQVREPPTRADRHEIAPHDLLWSGRGPEPQLLPEVEVPLGGRVARRGQHVAGPRLVDGELASGSPPRPVVREAHAGDRDRVDERRDGGLELRVGRGAHVGDPSRAGRATSPRGIRRTCRPARGSSGSRTGPTDRSPTGRVGGLDQVGRATRRRSRTRCTAASIAARDRRSARHPPRNHGPGSGGSATDRGRGAQQPASISPGRASIVGKKTSNRGRVLQARDRLVHVMKLSTSTRTSPSGTIVRTT